MFSHRSAHLAVAFLVVLGPFLEAEEVEGQVICVDCIDDMQVYEHKTASLPPPFGWYKTPCGPHVWWRTGVCFYKHDAGCFHDEDDGPNQLELLQEISVSEGQSLRELVEMRQPHLLIQRSLGLVGVRGCDELSVFWVPLRETQIRALAGVQMDDNTDPK